MLLEPVHTAGGGAKIQLVPLTQDRHLVETVKDDGTGLVHGGNDGVTQTCQVGEVMHDVQGGKTVQACQQMCCL